MIINASKRCDIPAYFSEWIFNILQKRKVMTKNPYSCIITEYNLNPDNDFIIFWSKNPIPMLNKIQDIENLGYKSYWQYTINNYKEFEPHIPNIDARLTAFKKITDTIGKERVIWRYDPIMFTKSFDTDCHLKEFEKIAKHLHGYTDKVVISFVDEYTKISGFLKSIAL